MTRDLKLSRAAWRWELRGLIKLYESFQYFNATQRRRVHWLVRKLQDTGGISTALLVAAQGTEVI